MYSDTVTLFNRRRLVGHDEFYATALYGVDFNADLAQIMSRYGADSQNKALLHVKYTLDDGAVMIGDKTYLAPKAWQRQTEDDEFSASLTFTGGQGFDFFILGTWDGAAIISDSDYTAGFYDYCNKLYDNCYAITSASQFSVIPHFEITGR